MIEHLPSVLDNALLQGLGYGVAVVGVIIAFRVLKYPDLTADGSFLIGAAIFAATSLAGASWFLALVAAIGGAAAAGVVTALLHTHVGVNRLLSGILTAMMCYSVAFWLLSGRSNVELGETPTMFSTAQSFDKVAPWEASQLHLATVLVEELGRRPRRYYTAGLGLANGLVGFAGCLVAARQGFADAHMGVGIIIVLVAALVIGEELMRLMGLDPSRSLAGRAMSGVLGACVYYFLYLFILRASILGYIPVRIQPTDLKLIAALLVVLLVAIRTYARKRSEQGEEVLPI